jgi:hypothetical protein
LFDSNEKGSNSLFSKLKRVSKSDDLKLKKEGVF